MKRKDAQKKSKPCAGDSNVSPGRTVHQVCNAHLDPVWLWTWEEGAGEALSTFRVAADFCEQYDGFIFNHNESLLYEWVEEYDPALFERIRRLVKAGRWHIMGGWFLQPDCSMPSGESLVRQIVTGKRFFREKFGVEPSVAINVDPFGHSRGLVQILAKSGYEGYVFFRPDNNGVKLPAEEFVWEGFDGSRVLACRPWGGYGNQPGEARGRLEECLRQFPDKRSTILFWGIGNHGGGPSRQDWEALEAVRREVAATVRVCHSTPEAFFADLKNQTGLPVYTGELAGGGAGYYSSMARLKQKHRWLESDLWRTEKMATQAWLHRLLPYPAQELAEATRDLLFSEFHDALPGSSIAAVEEQLHDKLGHGREILNRVRARAFFALAAGEPAAAPGEFPLLAYNPHPYPVRQTFDVEMSLVEWTAKKRFTPIAVYQDGKRLPCQVEQHASNHNIDWRKRLVFTADCAPASMTRFVCKPEAPLPEKPRPAIVASQGLLVVHGDEHEVAIDTQTGLIARYRVKGRDVLAPRAFCPEILQDTPDPWAFGQTRWDAVIGKFQLADAEENARFSGLSEDVAPSPVRVIEEGDIRTVVEAVLVFRHSFICQRYLIPKHGSELGIETRVCWNEKDSMLKLNLPFSASVQEFCGQTAYGTQPFRIDGTESCAQQWVAVSLTGDTVVTCINDGIYASDCRERELRLTLLRSPSYAGMPFGNNPLIVQSDRFSPRQEQGEHVFRFWLNTGPAAERLPAVDLEAQLKHEPPFVMPFSPAGSGSPLPPAIRFGNPGVRLAAMKRAEDNDDLILRVFNPSEAPVESDVTIPPRGVSGHIELGPFEIQTLRLSRERSTVLRVNLLEDRLEGDAR